MRANKLCRVCALLASWIFVACAGEGPRFMTEADAAWSRDTSTVPLDASVPMPSPDASTDCVDSHVAGARAELDLCRTCHVAGGLAASDEWSLSEDWTRDVVDLRAAWLAIGDELIKVPSQIDGREHASGTLLPLDTPAYQRFGAALAAIEDPGACDIAQAATAFSPLPLIGSSHGGHRYSEYCADQPDDAPLPIDPRTLVQPGVNGFGAVHFNAYWVDCDAEAPTTCGDYRAAWERGRAMMEGGRMAFFGGHHIDAALTISALDYNLMWRDWGLFERPGDFDQRVAERWGIPLADARNPYPLLGEDPNLSGGGSGQLPVALTQLRDDEGRYLGRVSFNCHWCHSGKVGDNHEGEGLGTRYGSGNSLLDISAGFGKFAGGMTALLPLAANKTRGTGDILLYPAIAALDVDRAQHYNDSLINAPSQGSVDYPVWWNLGHRTRRFHDGSFAMDDARPVMGFFMPIATYSRPLDIEAGRRWIDERGDDVQRWTESLRAPHYPGPIDRRLADAGAVLFHNKDLWAYGMNNDVPRPEGGNGSCASCHGVYAPRYVNDTRYLATPELDGIAAYIVPMEIIDTDPARFASLNDGLKRTLSYSWWGYGTSEAPGACFGVTEPGGYLAPPLHGIWASAPYFHNASVPNVWEVLKPSERPTIWRRVSAPAPANAPDSFMGFDTNLARAYDHERLGWRYDVLECGDAVFEPALACNSADPETNQAANALVSDGFSDVWFSWNIAPQPVSAATLEERKIYNTHKYSQSNRGHRFTEVLTDPERRALIEYLKTL